jgi:hypothetical protein
LKKFNQKMKNLLFIPSMMLACLHLPAQTFLNGSFETNTAIGDQINLSNTEFNSMVSNCISYGGLGNLDLITSADYCSLAPNGNWYVGMARGDKFSLQLNSSLSSGATYTITYQERFCLSNPVYLSSQFNFGVSTSSGSFGDTIYITPSAPIEGPWSARSFSFVSPNSGQYINVEVKATSGVIWVEVDDFSISSGGTSTDESDLESNGWVNPNPANTHFTLPSEADGASVTVNDMMGKTVLNIPNYRKEMGSISIEGLPVGFYMVQVAPINGRTMVQRLLKSGQ